MTADVWSRPPVPRGDLAAELDLTEADVALAVIAIAGTLPPYLRGHYGPTMPAAVADAVRGFCAQASRR